MPLGDRLVAVLIDEQLRPEDGNGALFAQAIALGRQAPEFRTLVLRAARCAGGPITVAVNNSGVFPSARWVRSQRRVEINTQANSTLEEQLASLIFELANACRSDCFDAVQAKFVANMGTKRPRTGPPPPGWTARRLWAWSTPRCAARPSGPSSARARS